MMNNRKHSDDTGGPSVFVVQSVGTVESPITEQVPGASLPDDPAERKKELATLRQSVRDTVALIRVRPEYASLLDGIDAFSHIVVLFWPHKLGEEQRRREKVHPRGLKDLPRQGIFATRSPARPNPVLVSTVELVKRQGPVLQVRGLEAFDNTPVIDIKPVVRPDDGLENFRVPDWVGQVLG